MIIHHSEESSKCKASSIIVEIELISSRGYKNEKTNCHEFMRHMDTTGTPYLCLTLLSTVDHRHGVAVVSRRNPNFALKNSELRFHHRIV